MDYVFGEGDKKKIIEFYDKGKTTQRDRLLGYYLQFRTEFGEISDEERSVLKRIAYSLSEKDAQERCSIIEARQKERLSAYYKAVSSLNQKHNDELQDIKDTVSDLTDMVDLFMLESVSVNKRGFCPDHEVKMRLTSSIGCWILLGFAFGMKCSDPFIVARIDPEFFTVCFCQFSGFFHPQGFTFKAELSSFFFLKRNDWDPDGSFMAL